MWSHLKDKGIKIPNITANEINKKVELVLRQMEKTGILIDVKILNDLAKKTEKNLTALESKIHKIAKDKFNISSPTQMAEVLFKKLKLPVKDIKRTKNGYSTAASELKKLQKKHKIIAPILEYRELSKLLSTYLKPLPALADENGRLHTTYGMETTTGRINSAEPNLQNIPIKGECGAEIRKAFIASPGMKLIAADYSQIELRVVACLADDKKMKEAFVSGQDIHARTAAEIFNIKISEVTAMQRRVAKTVNFGVLYGMSPYGLSQALSIDQEKAGQFISRYFEAHLGIKDYCNRMIDCARKEGYVETLFGLRRNLSEINSPMRNVADSEERMAINTPVQGTAAEILKLAMIELNSNLQEARMLLTIHDELIIEAKTKEVPKVARLMKDVMENVIKLCVPIEVEVETGQNWGEMRKI